MSLEKKAAPVGLALSLMSGDSGSVIAQVDEELSQETWLWGSVGHPHPSRCRTLLSWAGLAEPRSRPALLEPWQRRRRFPAAVHTAEAERRKT